MQHYRWISKTLMTLVSCVFIRKMLQCKKDRLRRGTNPI